MDLRMIESSIDFSFNIFVFLVEIILTETTYEGGAGLVNRDTPLSEGYLRSPTPMF